MKPLVAAAIQQKSDPSVFMANTNQPPIALEPLREDLRKVLLAAAVTAVAGGVDPPMAPTEEPMVVANAEAEATRTATPPAMHVAAMTPATGSTRYAAPRRLPKSATATASPPTHHNFALCFFSRSSNLSGSPSTMRSKIQFNDSGAMP
jgi:hypothetical protein